MRISFLLIAVVGLTGCIEVPTEVTNPGIDDPFLNADGGDGDGDDVDDGGTSDAGGPPPCSGAKCGAFTTIGGPATPRTRHEAVLLDGGKVLLIGGDGGGMALNSTEFFNPSTELFEPGPALIEGRYDAAAVRLLDGRVLIVGGFSNTHLATAEIFDPTVGTFTSTGSMAEPRIGHTVTLVPDGRVVVAGGLGSDAYAATVEIYDPNLGTFSALTTLNEPRFFHAAVVDGDDVLVIGGAHVSTRRTSVERIDVANGQRFNDPPLSTARFVHTATRLADRVLVVGGRDSGALSSVETLLSTDAPSGLISERWGHEATALADGRVLVSGGLDADGAMPWCELYDVATNGFEPVASMARARHSHSTTLLDDGRVLVVGGSIEFEIVDGAELFTSGS